MAAPLSERQQALRALSAELARTAGLPAEDAQVHQQILQQLVSATEALGGAFWLLTRRTGQDLSFRAGASLSLEPAAGEPESEQRQQVLRAATETVLSSQPLVLMPSPAGKASVTPGVLVNLGPHAILSVPLRSGDDSLGALQLWFPAHSEPKKLADIALMMQGLMADLGPRLRSRHFRELGAQSQRQQQLLQFASDLTGILDTEVAAKLAAGHARELLGINRVSILVRQGDRWRVWAISGLETVDARSGLVTEMRRFVSARAAETPWVAVREEQDAYFQDSHMQSALLVPLREGPEGRVMGSLLAESVNAATFGPPGTPGNPCPPSVALAQWLANLAGKSLAAALAHQNLPLSGPLSALGKWRTEMSGTRRRRWFFKAAFLAAIVAIAALWPMKVRVEADCSLLPVSRALITAESPGRIEKVLVREGETVKKGQLVARLESDQLQSALDTVSQVRKRQETEASRQRGLGKEALARIAALEADVEAEKERHLRQQIERASLHSPLDGIVMTKDVHLKNGMFLQAGELLAEVAAVDAWDLRLEIPEADISLIEQGLDEQAPLTVDYLLYTQSSRRLHASIRDKGQISPVLQPSAEGGRFSITLPRVELPAEMKPLMRPGLTGRAKVELGRKPAGAVLLRKFTRWLQMRWWL